MGREKLLTLFTAWGLSAGLSWGGVMCLATAFSLPVDSPQRLFARCALGAFAAAALLIVRRGGFLWGLSSAFLMGYFWRLEALDRQLAWLLQHISAVYDSAYHWGALSFSVEPRSLDRLLALLGWGISGTVCFHITRGKGSFPAVIAGVLPLLPCLVVTDTVPQTPYLLLTMAGTGLLLLSAGVRRQSVAQGNRLAARAALPVVCALGLLLWLVPRQGYVNQTGALRSKILTLGLRLNEEVDSAVSRLTAAAQQETDTVELARLGERHPSSVPVMQLTAPTTGSLYLRERDWEEYTGTGWRCDPSRQELFTTGAAGSGAVTIRTREALPYRFVPYYPAQPVTLSGGRAENPEGVREYTLACGPLALTSGSGGAQPSGELTAYLTLPEQTRAGAADLLAQVLSPGLTTTQTAAAIGDFVRSRADYDLKPDIMAAGAPDFALWFLREADRGYCVHFATAAAVLLRAADIPARYVTGYLAHTRAGETVTVTGKEAHAWAEYYDPALDAWLILEATPPPPEEAAPAQTAPAAETLPPPTEAESAAPELPTASPTEQPLSGEKTAPPGWLVASGWGAALTAGLCLAAAGQRALRLALRRRCRRRGSPNQRALALWREAELLHRLCGIPPREELIALARKAKFSQHRLTGEELELLERSIADCRVRLARLPLHRRLICKYLYAAL